MYVYNLECLWTQEKGNYETRENYIKYYMYYLSIKNVQKRIAGGGPISFFLFICAYIWSTYKIWNG